VALLSDAPIVTAAVLGLPPPIRAGAAGASLGDERRAALEADADTERTRLLEALRTTGWNLSRAAARLGVPRNTLRYRMEKLELSQRSPVAAPAPGSMEVSRLSVGAPQSRGSAGEPDVTASVQWVPRRVVLLRARLAAGLPEGDSRESSRAMAIVIDKVESFGGPIDEPDATGSVATFGLEPLDDAPRRAAYVSLAVHRAVGAWRGDPGPRTHLALALHAERLPVARVGGALEVDLEAKRRAREILE